MALWDMFKPLGAGKAVSYNTGGAGNVELSFATYPGAPDHQVQVLTPSGAVTAATVVCAGSVGGVVTTSIALELGHAVLVSLAVGAAASASIALIGAGVTGLAALTAARPANAPTIPRGELGELWATLTATYTIQDADGREARTSLSTPLLYWNGSILQYEPEYTMLNGPEDALQNAMYYLLELGSRLDAAIRGRVKAVSFSISAKSANLGNWYTAKPLPLPGAGVNQGLQLNWSGGSSQRLPTFEHDQLTDGEMTYPGYTTALSTEFWRYVSLLADTLDAAEDWPSEYGIITNERGERLRFPSTIKKYWR
jgi:hypothetical protein